MFVFMLFMQRRPHTFNYPNPITEDNAVRQYTNAVRMIRVLKICICLVFIVIEYSSTITMVENGKADAKWMFLGIFLLVQLPLFYFLIQASKDK